MAIAPNNSGNNEHVGSTPPKLPPWISEALIRRTLEVWNPRYGFKLTREDAIEMILCVGRLFGVMSRNGRLDCQAQCADSD